jgi:hypothetical protein
MVGSYWAFDPRHRHSVVCAPNVAPPFDDVVSAMNGEGQWLEQPGGCTP